MTEPVKPNQPEESPDPEVVSSSLTTLPPEVVAPAPIKRGGGLSVVAILFSLAALAVSGFSYYKNEIDGRAEESRLAINMVEIGGNVSRLGDSISRLQADQSNVVSKEQLSTRILESNNAVDLQFRDVKQTQGDLQNAIAKINDDLTRGVNDFVIAEVSQLLKLANNSVLFSSDTRSAIKALQLADIQLKEIADPRFATVRRKINQEIGLLESIEQADIESVTVKLKTLAMRIPTLALENDVPVLGEVTIKAEEKAEGWKAWLNEIWVDVINYNSVQRIDKAPKPLLLPEQRYFLNQNIQLQFAKAELGLLQNRASVYSDSLEVASELLKEYFDLRADAVKQVLVQIGELQAISLSQQLPSISGSYSELQTIRGGQ